MFLASLPPDTPFILTVIGTQPHTPAPLRETLASLLEAAKTNNLLAHTETLTQHPNTSQIHLTYWPLAAYQQWSASPEFTAFWSSLPDNAGIFRETLSVDPSRIQGATSQNKPAGCMHLGKIELNPTLSGYWGCYPDRIQEKSISTSLTAEEKSTLPTNTTTTTTTNEDGTIVDGRITLTHFPHNICFVVEGQDHTRASAEEQTYWTEHFDALSQKWVSDAVDAGVQKGVLSSRACYSPAAAAATAAADKRYPLTLGRDVQLFYFTDLDHMEKLGKSNGTHVKLRRSFMEAYGPGGVLFGGGLVLWVETAVLRGEDIQAEYVGCLEGTGLLGFRGHAAFSG
ncbi:hypothetical protein BO71DRAFT_69961 [Aspergillus ellipticus CBS 707.79]|uniref:Aldoxime dehydratase n=1 Tax=Aspergillus ellipticus CBS 707.79 TaxID=1448320 RepID=A0A319DKW3_9EURO|nr:hypothetical protein BO71DRAFT_69961 [Aspergillus ellipticus CBS 707.79]